MRNLPLLVDPVIPRISEHTVPTLESGIGVQHKRSCVPHKDIKANRVVHILGRLQVRRQANRQKDLLIHTKSHLLQRRSERLVALIADTGIQADSVHIKRVQTVKIDYQKYPGCPMWLVERCMAIYQAIKSEMRKRKRMLDAKNKEKAEKLKSSGL